MKSISAVIGKIIAIMYHNNVVNTHKSNLKMIEMAIFPATGGIVLIFAIDAKSEDFPGIRKVFCCGKIPIKTSKKSKIAQKIFGGPCFSGPGGSIGPPVPVTWEPLKQ